MTAVLFYGPGDIRLEQVPLLPLRPGEVLVKIGAGLTCGTDFKTFRRGHPVLMKSIPSPFGHEMAGTVAEVGEGVVDFKVGQRVVPANSAPCGACFYCQHGQPNLCEDLLFLHGAFAEFIVVPARIVTKNLHKIPDALKVEHAALAEPLACVIHALDKMRLARGETLAVIGTGPMTLLFVLAAEVYGARTLVLGRSEEKLAIVKQAGAAHVIPLGVADRDALAAAVREKTASRAGADLVVDATAQPELWELAVGLARRGGRVCLYGGCIKGTTFQLDTYRVHYEELTVAGVFHHTPAHFKRAIEMLASGAIAAQALIGRTCSLSDIHTIFAPQQRFHPPLKTAVMP